MFLFIEFNQKFIDGKILIYLIMLKNAIIPLIKLVSRSGSMLHIVI